MFILFVVLSSVAFAALIAGFSWGLVVRGRTSTRKGPEIYGELMEEKMDREALRKGGAQLARKAASGGKGVAWEREAEYSWGEIRCMLREHRLRKALPPLLVLGGMIGLTLFLGLALLVRLRWKIFGLGLLAFTAYAVYLAVQGWRESD